MSSSNNLDQPVTYYSEQQEVPESNTGCGSTLTMFDTFAMLNLVPSAVPPFPVSSPSEPTSPCHMDPWDTPPLDTEQDDAMVPEVPAAEEELEDAFFEEDEEEEDQEEDQEVPGDNELWYPDYSVRESRTRPYQHERACYQRHRLNDDGQGWWDYRSNRARGHDHPGWREEDESAERLRLHHAHSLWRRRYICDNQGSVSWIWNRICSNCHGPVCCDHVTEVVSPMYQMERHRPEAMLEFYVGEATRMICTICLPDDARARNEDDIPYESAPPADQNANDNW
eukprot:5695343-Amphidinium_carterae.4